MIDDPNDPRRRRPEACQTMDDVRYEVDRIDRLLVQILTERQGLMAAAARIKPTREAVRDTSRIEDVVSKVLRACATSGLDPAIAEPVWRTLIERCIAYEFELWDAARNPAANTPGASASDTATPITDDAKT